MMLGGPQHVEAELVHELGDVAGSEERLAQPVVRIAALVGGRAVEPDIVELDLADIKDVEFLDHARFSNPIRKRLRGGVNTMWAGPHSRAALCLRRAALPSPD